MFRHVLPHPQAVQDCWKRKYANMYIILLKLSLKTQISFSNTTHITVCTFYFYTALYSVIRAEICGYSYVSNEQALCLEDIYWYLCYRLHVLSLFRCVAIAEIVCAFCSLGRSAAIVVYNSCDWKIVIRDWLKWTGPVSNGGVLRSEWWMSWW